MENSDLVASCLRLAASLTTFQMAGLSFSRYLRERGGVSQLVVVVVVEVAGGAQ